MEQKNIYLGLLIGSVIGGYIPALWGAGIFSVSSVIGGVIGALAGIYLMVKFLG